MIAEAVQPLVKELPPHEKRRLLEWLKHEVGEAPRPVNAKLRERLIRHITGKKHT